MKSWKPCAGFITSGKGTVIVNSQELYPLPVLTGSTEYPVDTMERICGKVSRAIEIDALGIAEKCGSPKVVNTVLLGVLAGLLDSDLETWRETIRETVPPRRWILIWPPLRKGKTEGKSFSQVGN